MMIKRVIQVFTAVIYLSSVAPVSAQDSTQAQLDKIYGMYNQSPIDSCAELEKYISLNRSTLGSDELRKAYYFLGNCQYSFNHLDKAVEYYRLIVQLDPNDPKVLLDLGTVNVQQGLYKEAENNYRKALSLTTDLSEKEKINTMISNIPNKLQKVFTASTSIGYDSNVNSGPKDTNHLFYDTFNYTLTSQEKSREDFYNNNSVGAALSKALNPKTYLLINADINHTNYFKENNFNTLVLSSSMGYRKIFDNKYVTIGPFVNYETLDNESYQVTGGINLAGYIKTTDKINIFPHLGWYSQNFYNNNARDSMGISLGSSATYAFNNKTSLISSLFYTSNRADNNLNSYDSIFLGNSLQRSLFKYVTASVGYNLQLYYYDDEDPAFGSSREDDGHYVFVNVDYSLKKYFRLQNAFVGLNVSYNQNNSNHSFQENDRLFSALKFTISF